MYLLKDPAYHQHYSDLLLPRTHLTALMTSPADRLRKAMAQKIVLADIHGCANNNGLANLDSQIPPYNCGSGGGGLTNHIVELPPSNLYGAGIENWLWTQAKPYHESCAKDAKGVAKICVHCGGLGHEQMVYIFEPVETCEKCHGTRIILAGTE